MASKLTFKKRTNPNSRELATGSIPYYTSRNPFPKYNSGRGSYGNCTWYAYGRFLEIWSSAPEADKKAHPWKNWSSFPNACSFYEAAKSSGYQVGLTPRPGAIGVWGYYGNYNGQPGHVVIVESVTMDANKNITSIEISNSGWSSGDLPNRSLYPGTGQQGTGAWKLGYNNSYFKGFIYNPITFAGSEGTVSGVTEQTVESTSEELTSSAGIDFQKRSSKLSSSDNFSFIKQEKENQEKSTGILSIVAAIKDKLNKKSTQIANEVQNKGANLDNFMKLLGDSFLVNFNKTIKTTPKIIKQKSFLSLAENVVEAPFIELQIGDYRIGSYNGSLDKYPNYISDLQVTKQNGVINQYVIKLTHQIRPGDDSNLLDELLSTVNFDKITIKYGDCNSGTYFEDVNAIITNVKMNRNYSGMNISYVLEATSEGQLIKTYTTNFPEVTDKPSNVLRDVIYNNPQTSEIVLSAFPGMRNRTFVESNNLLPTNDSIVTLEAQKKANILDYINYCVACMSNNVVIKANNIIRDSVYYSTFVDNDVNSEGAYIQVKELKSNINPFGITDKIYDITIGFPDDIIYDFSIDNTNSWELLYKNNNPANEYAYTITTNGDIDKYYSPSISSSSKILSEIDKNWWTQMIKFPITATLTLKGLLKPIMLMDYININVVFYGQPHIASGVYAITGQVDYLSGAGYKTVLSLVRVGNA